jgi:hypothetical protein
MRCRGPRLVAFAGLWTSLLPVKRPARPMISDPHLLCWPWSQDAPSQFRVYHADGPVSLATYGAGVDQCVTPDKYTVSSS